MDWNPVSNFKQQDTQSLESFEEQKIAVVRTANSIDKYLDYRCQRYFVKCTVISGSPGSGKSFILNYMALYAMCKGLKLQ